MIGWIRNAKKARSSSRRTFFSAALRDIDRSRPGAVDYARIPHAGTKAIDLSLTTFEKRRHKVISRPAFAARMLRAIGLWFAITTFGMTVGMAGYAYFEGWSLTDSFLNAAMILSGMGPATPLITTTGKLFAGFYAIFSGLIIIIATGFVLAPIFHRVLHKFHVETSEDR